MTGGILIGAAIVLYFLFAVWFLFLGLLSGIGGWAVLFGIFWPVAVPTLWLQSKWRNR